MERINSKKSDNIKSKKLEATNIFDCSDLTAFIASIRAVLPITSFSDSRFFICEIDNVKFLTKLTFYSKTPAQLYNAAVTPGAISQNDAELKTLSLLDEEIVNKNISPCIVRLIYYKICNNINKVLPNKICDELLGKTTMKIHERIYDIFCDYYERMRSGIVNNQFCFTVLEQCDLTFDEYIRDISVNKKVNINLIKSLLFQILYTSYRIKKKYPGYKHGDLHTNNVMLIIDKDYDYQSKIKKNKQKYIVFKDGQNTYSVPYFGIICKIIDFAFTNIPEANIVSNIIDDKVMMYDRQHIDNDLIPFFSWTYHELHWCQQVVDLLKFIEPNESYKYYTRVSYLRKIREKIPSYADMMRAAVWDDYKIAVSDESIWEQFDG